MKTRSLFLYIIGKIFCSVCAQFCYIKFYGGGTLSYKLKFWDLLVDLYNGYVCNCFFSLHYFEKYRLISISVEKSGR